MTWDLIRTQYLQKMERATALLAKAGNLRSQVGSDLPADLGQALDQLVPQMSRQLTKLRENQFHVAVIGLEKAGKSALINAWLGVEILPQADERCTYTTTEIQSAPNEGEQFYEIEFLTRDAFDRDLADKERKLEELDKKNPQGTSSRDHQNLRREVEETRRLRPQIQGQLGQPALRREFHNVIEIRGDLRRYIAEPQYARAVKRIVLHTVALRAARDIVFHDVPGFNSPVEIHKKQAEQQIAQCDAILFAKSLLQPTTEGNEVQMLDFADAEDPYIRASAKTFVALTKIDLASSRRHFEELWHKSRQEWKDFPSERIVPVCPPARLFRNGTGEAQVMRDGEKILADLQALGVEDGIDKLKTAVQAYIDDERAHVVKKRCDALTSSLSKICRRMIDLLSSRYPEFTGDLQEAANLRFSLAFHAWWETEWKRIEREFIEFYDQKAMPKAKDPTVLQPENPQLAAFRTRYRDLLGRLGVRATKASPEEIRNRYKVVAKGDDGREEPVKAHSQIRWEISSEAMQVVNQIGAELSTDLMGAVGQLTDKAVELLWGIDEVRSALAVEPEKLKIRVEHGISTLFLRFARPAINIFLATPRALPDRDRVLRTYTRDIKVLSEFYEGSDRSHKNLEGYLSCGSWSSGLASSPGPQPTPPSTAGKVADALQGAGSWINWALETPATVAVAATVAAVETLATPRPKPAEDVNTIIAEIGEDLTALGDYLENSVFTASGFQPYWNQELDRVRNKFQSLERDLSSYVQAAYNKKNPAVRKAAPKLGQDAEYLRLVAHAMAAVESALAELETKSMDRAA